MGIFKPFIGGVKDAQAFQSESHEHDKPFTVPDILTVSRPLLAVKAASMLLNSEKGVFPIVAIMGATDMEGKVARVIDKVLPNSGLGSTEHGAAWDTYADTLAILIVAGATLRAPRVTLPAKLATATILGQEGSKTAWALTRNHAYQRATGHRLKLPSSEQGKEAMAEKLSALGLAVATNDTDNPYVRASLSAAALGFAGIGSLRGERARVAYEPMIEEMLHNAQLAGMPGIHLGSDDNPNARLMSPLAHNR